MSDKTYLTLAENFGKLLAEEDYDAAYQMTSSHLRDRMTFGEFVQTHRTARERFGIPLSVEGGVGEVGRQSLGNENFELPHIPEGIRRAWAFAYMAIEHHPDGRIRRSYQYRMMIVEEHGQDRIAHFECDWSD